MCFVSTFKEKDIASLRAGSLQAYSEIFTFFIFKPSISERASAKSICLKINSGLKILIKNKNWPWKFVPNINVPAVPSDEVEGVSVSQQGYSTSVSPLIEKRKDLRQQEYMWLYLSKEHGHPGDDEDISVLRSNRVSVSFLTRSITDQEVTSELSSLFEK